MSQKVEWTTVGELEIGDKVPTPNGEFGTIKAIHEQGEDDMHRVHIDDDTYLDVSLDHRFKVLLEDLGDESRTVIMDDTIIETEAEATQLQATAEQYRALKIPAYGNAPTVYKILDNNKVTDANSWFPHDDPSNDGEQVIESARSQAALEGIPDHLLALVWLYGRPKSSIKDIPTNLLDVPSTATNVVTGILNSLGVEHKIDTHYTTPRTTRIIIEGSISNNIKLAYQLENSWEHLVKETDVLTLGRANEIVKISSEILSRTGAIEVSRAKALHIKLPKSTTILTGRATWVPGVTTALKVPAWNAGQDFIYGFMIANGNQTASPRSWTCSIVSRQTEAEFLKRGLNMTVTRVAGKARLTGMTRVPLNKYTTCNDFTNNYTPKDKDEVIKGILAGSLVTIKNGEHKAYITNNDKTREYIPEGIISGKDGQRLEYTPNRKHVIEAIDISTSTLEDFYYDADGYPVASMPWIFENCYTGKLARSGNAYNLGLTAAGVIVTPKIVERKGKTFASASMPIDLYRVDEVLDALANVYLQRNAKKDMRRYREGPQWSNVSVEDLIGIIERVERNKAKSYGGGNRDVYPKLPKQEPVVYPGGLEPSELAIHPYVLGCWLGDGSLRGGTIGSADMEMFDTFKSLGYEVKLRKNGYKEGRKDFWVGSLFKDGQSLRSLLTEIGIPTLKEIEAMDKADRKQAKFIPSEFLLSSVESRLEIIRGLMDTDGTHSGIFSQVNKNIADGIVEIARSLGMRASIKEKVWKSGFDNPEVGPTARWMVTLNTDKHRIFNLSRKIAKWDERPHKQRHRTIRRIEKLNEKAKSRCITIDTSEHVFVAGQGFTPSRQSVVLHNQICQLMLNNDPSDLQIKIVEPKVGTQIFENADSVTGYVDSWFPREGELFEATLDMVRGLTEEMIRRNKIMRLHPGRPEKLAEARDIALREGPQPDGSPHPMWLPFIICYIEECAMLFAPSPNKDDREVQAEILYYVTKLAREARSAGIHLVLATQYPTNASLPSVIRQQCRRLGLKTQDQVASQVIINETGLENLVYKGTGKLSVDGRYRDFKGFLLEHEEHNNDVFNTLDKIGTNGGLFSTASATTSDGFIEVPPLEASLFAEWDSGSLGKAVKSMYDTGRKSRDIDTDIMNPDDPRVVDEDALRNAVKSHYSLN